MQYTNFQVNKDENLPIYNSAIQLYFKMIYFIYETVFAQINLSLDFEISEIVFILRILENVNELTKNEKVL